MADGNNIPDGGEGLDACSLFASIFNQRRSVERLLNWLRESQTTCTDSNCFDDFNGLPRAEHGSQISEGSLMQGEESMNEADPFALVLWFAVGLLTLFAMTLNRDRNNAQNEMHGIDKSRNNDQRDNQDDDHDRFRRRDDNDRPAL